MKPFSINYWRNSPQNNMLCLKSMSVSWYCLIIHCCDSLLLYWMISLNKSYSICFFSADNFFLDVIQLHSIFFPEKIQPKASITWRAEKYLCNIPIHSAVNLEKYFSRPWKCGKQKKMLNVGCWWGLRSDLLTSPRLASNHSH